MYCRWRSSYQEGRDSIRRFNLATFVYHNYIIEFDSRPPIRSTRYDFSFWNIEKKIEKFSICILIYIFSEILSNFGNFEVFWKFTFFGNLEIVLPPTHGLYLTPLPMVFWPPTHDISNPLLWYYELLSFGRNEGGFNLPWRGSKYNDKKMTLGSKYHMENWTRGQNIIGKLTRVQFTMGFKIPYDTVCK